MREVVIIENPIEMKDIMIGILEMIEEIIAIDETTIIMIDRHDMIEKGVTTIQIGNMIDTEGKGMMTIEIDMIEIDIKDKINID